MAPLLHRQPYKTIYLLGFAVVTVFVQLPCWLIYYSWPPNRPRANWTLHRTINAWLIRRISQLPFRIGIFSNRDLSLEVPQEELESHNARFVWIPELEKEDVVGLVAKHADRAGIKSIAIPAYWFLKEGTKWSPAHDKAQKDEKVLLYIHGGAFAVRLFSPSWQISVLTLTADGHRAPISPNGVHSQGNRQSFHISLPSVIDRLPTQFRPSLGTKEPIPNRGHRRHCWIQISRLRGRISAPEHHRGW